MNPKQSFNEVEAQARLIRALLWLCFAVQALFYVLAWGGWHPAIGSWWMDVTATGVTAPQVLAMAPRQQMLGAASDLPALLAMGFGLWRLDRMLAGLRLDALFTLGAIGHLRAFAGATLASIVLSILATPARGLLFRWFSGAPERHLAMGVNSDQLALIVVCTLFYLITTMMHEGRRLAEENEGFV